MSDLNQLIKDTVKLKNKFEAQGNKYDKRSRLIDLVEEVGELAQAIHIVEGFKKTNDPKKSKTKEDVADAICDILYELILLAKDYQLDLPQEYQEMLVRLNERVDNGEFDNRATIE